MDRIEKLYAESVEVAKEVYVNRLNAAPAVSKEDILTAQLNFLDRTIALERYRLFMLLASVFVGGKAP